MSRYLPTTTKERVVNAIITSRFDYSNSLLCGTTDNNIARLQRMHNSAARVILRRSRSDSAMPILCILHWLPVARRIDIKLLVFTYKAVHGDAPKYLSDLLCPYTPARALCSASNNMSTVRRTHVKAADSSFAIAAATLWNTLPNDIKMLGTLSTFKARLNTHFIDSHSSLIDRATPVNCLAFATTIGTPQYNVALSTKSTNLSPKRHIGK